MPKQQRHRKHSSLAAIEYHGIPGVTQECMDAVMRLIQFNNQITRVRILTWSNRHCLILTIDVGDMVAIKSGFTSGYIGEGPSGFSYIFQLLRFHGAEIVEYKVRKDMVDRLDSSCLTHLDLEWLEVARPVRPSRFSEYLDERDLDIEVKGNLWREFPCIIPFAIIDPRIADLAISFWQGPDEKLLTGYRRLEDRIRERTGLDEHGAKLFTIAFSGEKPKLKWKRVNRGEQTGRAGLFISAYQAFRNPRAHKELNYSAQEALTEFLLLNHLYHLETEAVRNTEAG